MGISMTIMCVPLETVAEGTSESPGQTKPRTEAERTEASTSLSLLDCLRASQP